MSSFFSGLFSQRKNIHNIVASGTIEQLNAAIKKDNGKSVNEITRGGKSTLSLLIQRHKSPSECMASSEDTIVKFGILLDYADHKNISIFEDALKDCPVDMNSKIKLILILLEKLTKGGEEMIKHITETERREEERREEERGRSGEKKQKYNADAYTSLKEDFDLAWTIRGKIEGKIEGNIDPFTGIKGSLDKVSSDKFKIIYKKIDNFFNFIKQPAIENYIRDGKDGYRYETMNGEPDIRTYIRRAIDWYAIDRGWKGGKRKQRKTKRCRKMRKRKSRRY
jgi:hypothetical protein